MAPTPRPARGNSRRTSHPHWAGVPREQTDSKARGSRRLRVPSHGPFPPAVDTAGGSPGALRQIPLPGPGHPAPSCCVLSASMLPFYFLFFWCSGLCGFVDSAGGTALPRASQRLTQECAFHMQTNQPGAQTHNRFLCERLYSRPLFPSLNTPGSGSRQPGKGVGGPHPGAS